jgi:hypothetical protein
MHRALQPPAYFAVDYVRALLGSFRKFIVPLMEYFDAVGSTRRPGDHRVLTQLVQRGE